MLSMYLLSSKRGVTLHLHKHPEILCTKFGLICSYLVLEKRFFSVIYVFLLLSQLLKRVWYSLTEGRFIPNLVQIGSVVLKITKMWKVYENFNNNNDIRWWTIDKFRSEKLTWACGSGELMRVAECHKQNILKGKKSFLLNLWWFENQEMEIS